MEDFDDHEHNDLITVEIRVDEIVKSGGERRVYKFEVSTADTTNISLIIWDGSPAVDADWNVGSWYRIEDVLFKRWDSTFELHGSNKATVEQIDSSDEADIVSNQDTNFTSNTNTKLLHVGPVNYGSSNITTKRRTEFHRAFDSAIDVAVQRDVDAVVLTGQLFATQSPPNKTISKFRDSLNQLHEADIPLLLAGSPRDRKFELVDILVEGGSIKTLSGSPVVIGDVAVYGTAPIEEASVSAELGSLEPIPTNAESAVLAIPGTISPPVADSDVSVDKVQSLSTVEIDAILAGDRRHRESHAPVEVSGCEVYQAGPIEYLLRKWVVEQPPEYPCSVRIIGPSTSEEVSIPHRPFAMYRVESPSTDDISILKDVIEAKDRTVLIQLSGPKGSNPLSKQKLNQWLQGQAAVSKIWDDRGKSTTNRPLNIESLRAEPSVESATETSGEDIDHASSESAPVPTESEGTGASAKQTEDDSTTDTRLYLAPCDDPEATLYLDRTIKTGIAENVHTQFTPNAVDGTLHLWGMTEQKGNQYRNLDTGDFVLFYTGDGTYEYAAKVISAERNSDLIENLELILQWDQTDVDDLDEWEYCIYLETPFRVEIESENIHNYAGHTVDKPFSFYRLNRKGRDAIKREHGSIDEYLQSHRVDDDTDTTDQRTSQTDTEENTDTHKELSDTPPELEQLASISGLDQGYIQDVLRQIESTGCSPDEAREWYCRYLADMLRGQGIFALQGVGPLSGRELIEFGITETEELQTANAQQLANKIQLSVTQITELQEDAVNEKYDSLEATNSDAAQRLINTYTTETSESESSANQRITRQEANELLEQSVGHQAEFRPQQWEAIDKLANERDQLLLVQRTGWGKSTVYFIATKAIRDDGGGPTLIISPLLSLMRDQIKNAEEELGLSALTINSKNEDDWEDIYEDILNSNCDLVLISPERLRNQEFREQVLSEMDEGFGMLVVDEAHCISDWGHDFRPDYQRVTRILDRLPANVPVAATTATANDRVVDDITTQLPGLEPIRGDLVRDSLRIQAINMGNREKRLAWLAENLPKGDRAGIVYCLTKDDVQRVTEWLPKYGYEVKSYHGGLDTEKRQNREQMLLNNEVDALVATNALGMGFDKPDLKYVIHFQRPQNLIRYYQEIGRAGRDLDTAHAVVLSGSDDDETAEYFIESSFPNASNFEGVLETIKTAEQPLSKWDIRTKSDASQVSRCLKMLEVDGAIERTDEGYVRTANQWEYDSDKFDRITEQRYAELERIQAFMETDRCLTLFIDEQLDGQMSDPCGRCANCTDDFYPRSVADEHLIEEAVKHYQNSGIHTIDNRVYRYLPDGSREKIPPENQLETGRSLSVYDEPGWGTAVKEGKYETGQFDESLVTGAAELLRGDWDPSPFPHWIAYIPSQSNEGLIRDYATRLADELDMEISDCVQKVRETEPQKELSGSSEKCDNVRDAFEITDKAKSGPVLLIDDIVASRWTLTEVGRKLAENGSGPVYPFALAKRRG